MRSLLTFLGAGSYQETTYALDGERHTSCYCPCAIAHVHHFDRVYVVVTAKAREMHWGPLQAQMRGTVDCLPVDIPDGRSEEELWGIFEALTEHFGEGDEIVVDITHGFRSLPFLSFLAIAYLRVAKGVQVGKVYYGAHDARSDDNVTPIFDLTPFVDLLDWSIGTDRFIRSGDARDLAALLGRARPPGHEQRADPAMRELGRQMGIVAKDLREISAALRLTRPSQAMHASHRLGVHLRGFDERRGKELAPFGLLLEQVQRAYAGFGLPRNASGRDPAHALRLQRELIQWYLEHEEYVQCVTLAREWLVSWVMLWLGKTELTDKRAREQVTGIINDEDYQRIHSRVRYRPTSLTDVPDTERVLHLWHQVAEVRNEINHAVDRPGSHSADWLIRKIGELVDEVGALPIPQEPSREEG